MLLLFPRWSDHRRQVAVKRWSRKLLSIVGVKLRYRELPQRLPERCLLVLNHVSWLDVFLVDALYPAVFVAKAEIRGWPLVGTLAGQVGTVFIERGSRRAARRGNGHIAAALASGKPVACFPEGTTTYGHGVNRFHGALFQAAIDAGATVQPVALRYRDPDGRPSKASAYVGEDSLIQSIWTLLSERALIAELVFLPGVTANGRERRSIARQVHADIARALASA